MGGAAGWGPPGRLVTGHRRSPLPAASLWAVSCVPGLPVPLRFNTSLKTRGEVLGRHSGYPLLNASV